MPKYFRPSPELRAAVDAYSASFYANTLTTPRDVNYVSSPFGSWLLLAVLAGSTDFTDASDNEEVISNLLGMTPAEAGAAAADVLENLSGAELGIGVWFDPFWALKGPRIASWLETNTAGTTENRIPPQEEMDAWTREVTHGLIDTFPVEIKPELMFLVASVVYTKFEWRDEYEVVEASTVPVMRHWRADNVMFLDEAPVEFYSTSDAVIAVHRAASHDGQIVYSAMPISGEFSDVGLLDFLHQISSYNLGDIKRLRTSDIAQMFPEFIDAARGESIVSLEWNEFDDENSPKNSVFFPAWEAESTHDLEDPSFGYEAEADTLAIDYPEDEYDGFTAKQSVVAKYGAKGFEAAAVTAFGMLRASAAFHKPEGAYRATVAFARPFASLCVINSLPLFGAVILKATEA